MALSVASQSVLQKQRILASFYEVLVPKLQALGQVGTLAQQRLAMLMADAGVMEGTPTPASEDELNMVVGQAVAALKRYDVEHDGADGGAALVVGGRAAAAWARRTLCSRS